MDEFIELDEWLDRWEAEVESGQSRISRQEAIKRYHKWVKSLENSRKY